MPTSTPPPQSDNDHSASHSWLADFFVAFLPVLACFLGGATQKWAEGIVMALLGLLLLIRPPRSSLGWSTNLILIALIVLAAVAFLPADWFFQSPWRSAFTDDLKIQLPSTLTAQTWITATQIVSFVAGLSWLYVCCTEDLGLREVRLQLRLFTSGIAMLAFVSIAFYLMHATVPFWHNSHNFGPFPNRNQTANLFGLSAILVLACAQDDVRKGRRRWMLWIVALVVLVTAIIINLSRAGVGLVVIGSAVWLGAIAFRKRSPSWIALGLCILLLLFSGLFLFGGETFERFHLHNLGSAGISNELRWRIYRDVFHLIHDSPWCGIGLGNFDPIFALYRDASLIDPQRAIHPESDWLWIWSELGWPAVVLGIAGFILIVRHVFPLREGTNQRYRLATLIASILFVIHGIVDVSGHRIGTAFAAALLLGLSLHRPLSLKRSRCISIVFRPLGLLLLVAGMTLVFAARGQKLLPSSVGVSNVKQLAAVSNNDRNFSETVSLTNRALDWAPLDWQVYFLRALAEVELKQTPDAVDDFRRARFLEPLAYDVPLAEGTAWLAASQPTLAATAWREALRRAGQRRPGVYSNMLNNASLRSPELSRLLEEVGLSEHDLALPYLARVSGPLFNRALVQILQNDPDLKSFTETEKLALFSFWSERGDPQELLNAVQNHPNWLPYAWLGVAKFKASQNDFRGAYELTQQYSEAVALPRANSSRSLEQLESQFRAAPDNLGIGYELYRAQMKSGRVDDALLTARHFSERSNAPAYFKYLEAQSWAEKQNWERAWTAWLAFHAAQTAK
jgi:O-antigen ligase